VWRNDLGGGAILVEGDVDVERDACGRRDVDRGMIWVEG
jgi:hypothetical protein